MATTRPEIRQLNRFFQLTALSAFAIAYPLLDLIRHHPDFLAVHRVGSGFLAVFVAILVLVPPLTLWALQALANRLDHRAGTIVQQALLALLLAVVLLPLLDGLFPMSGYVTVGLSASVAAAGLWIYRHFSALRNHLALLALTVPVFVGQFAFSESVGTAVVDGTRAAEAIAVGCGRDPVVVVILDELPLATLLDSSGGIDAALFPGFARLAERATWYPRTASVSGATLRAVPTILTGRFAQWNQPPTFEAHPRNLFSAVGGDRDVVVRESRTSLCPEGLAGGRQQGLGERLALLLGDAVVLYQHVVYPAGLRGGLPPVDNKWSDFNDRAMTAVDRSRHGMFRAWIRKIERTDRPLLAVIHSTLPHSPYRHYPDGRIYNWRKSIDHVVDGVWINDRFAVRDAFRRHLVQTMSVDRLLGELLDRLEEQRLLDDALLVVTADHGACFTPGQPNRKCSPENLHDLMSVPLFVKYPRQAAGRQDRRLAQTVDIFPTILAALDCDPVPGLDGMDLSEASTMERTELHFFDQNERVHHTLPPSRLSERDRTLQWKDSTFQGLTGLADVCAVDGLSHWLGRSLSELPLGGRADLELEIAGAERYGAIRMDRNFLPGEVSGRISGVGSERVRLAVAVNGRLAGSGLTYLDLDDDGWQDWSILMPDSAFREGSNTLEVLLVETGAGAPLLRPLSSTHASIIGIPLGARSVAGVGESGFHGPESWNGTPFRWTNGHARLEVPLLAGERADRLTISLVSTGPTGTTLRILVEGRALFEETVPRGPWSSTIRLPDELTTSRFTLEIVSGTFSPGENADERNDGRALGVGLAAVLVSGEDS